MHKLVAVLLLTLSVAALLSQEPASAVAPADSVRLVAQAQLEGELWNREDSATPGAYYEMKLAGGVRLSYRLAKLDAATARIDAIVVRDGRTLSEPTLEIARDSTASFDLESPALTVEFRIDAK